MIPRYSISGKLSVQAWCRKRASTRVTGMFSLNENSANDHVESTSIYKKKPSVCLLLIKQVFTAAAVYEYRRPSYTAGVDLLGLSLSLHSWRFCLLPFLRGIACRPIYILFAVRLTSML